MKRLILGFAAAALASLVSPLFAQTNETTFRSVASGLWTASENWKYESSGVWLDPSESIYPGDARHRNVSVVIDGGSTLHIGDGEVVKVNSIHVRDGELFVEGTLFVGDFSAESADVGEPSGNGRPASSLSLEQNVPNPVSPFAGTQTTFRFYLDREYAGVRLTLYDMLGAEIQTLFEASNPEIGWHSAELNVRNLPSGNYPVILLVPGMPAQRRLMTVVR